VTGSCRIYRFLIGHFSFVCIFFKL
jgi:hypothetical protein